NREPCDFHSDTQTNSLWPGHSSQGSGGAVWPCQPIPPSWPGQPTQPSCPGQQNLPTAPAWPGNPGQPGWPGQPGGQANYPGQPGWPSQNPSCTTQQWPGPPAGPLTVPYTMGLPRGVYDKLLITINGQVKANAKMFTVDFLRGNDIALHINPRFNEGGKQVIVRNHKVGERWGKEERDIQSHFPFIQGQPFEMKILCTYNEFRVAVNNIQVLEFKHRVRELNQINQVSIDNDITLSSVNVDTLP
ncbi:hypothetical protein MATL_G00136750, partial [Megalops atlanticus]